MPFEFNGVDSWVCAYKDNSGHLAAAITPEMNEMISWVKQH